MKVFVTGASGFVGSALLPELLEAGHQVIALARSDDAVAKIKSIGPEIKILRGSLEDLDVLRSGAKEADGVVHLGFIHDFGKYEESCKIDLAAVVAMLESIEGTNKAFVNTNGTLVLPLGKLAKEEDQTSGPGGKTESVAPRGKTESVALSFAERGVRVMSVRLPPTVHGKGDQAFIRYLIAYAKKVGKSVYVDEGCSVWPAVHRLDAAHLFRLVLEKGRAGRAYHGVAEEGVKTSLIAKSIGDTLHLPTASISVEEAQTGLGIIGFFLALDNPVSSEKTQAELGWEPANLKLLDDIKANY